ncbi:MAG: ribonuclease III [Okeania sp. SIO2C9]|uniref:ribonuclease III n=1 Tax=Okeania sp. SIO2C9 TaxID=2607791 RepID=UPI0013C20633|nr:ribonuclease III [Okeania sp. SIO2C9]NEQ75233.1 ribonuclease III [Okeania sp. SIO2C9]
MTKKLPEFKNPELLKQALTHRSFLNENSGEEDNESLEFLGDAVLGFLVGELLYRRYKEEYDLKPKELTRLRSLLVDEKQLAKFAAQLEIGELMRLGRGAEKDEGRQNPALLSDTFEAIIGAFFLDSNLTKVCPFVNNIFQPVADEIIFSENDLVDTKAKFQQRALGEIKKIPRYESNKCGGSDDKPIFLSEVLVDNIKYAQGEGDSKKDAEKLAAENALAKLKQEGLI